MSDRSTLQPLARLLAAVRAATGTTRLLLVGAAARDLLLVHARGIDAQRATEDTDLALVVPNWHVFLKLREALLRTRTFSPEGPAHRLWFGDQRLDFIPFGGVERPDRSIAWPPDGAEVMSVCGFSEALATAVNVRLPGEVEIDVVSLPGLALLKILAWSDRKYTVPGKDAEDLWLLLRHYADAIELDRLYGPEGEAVVEALNFDLEATGAWLLGRDSRDVLSHGADVSDTIKKLERILRPEIDPDGPLRLVAQMPPGDRDRQMLLLTAFYYGLFDASISRGFFKV